MALHTIVEYVRDLERGAVQSEALTLGLKPADLLDAFLVAQLGQALREGLAPLQTVGQAFASPPQ